MERPEALVTPDARAIDRIAQVLAISGSPGTFATQRTASGDELHLDVVGVGPIRMPLSAASARRLCDVARPARYGLRDQTLLDRNVRDAWEIGKRQVRSTRGDGGARSIPRSGRLHATSAWRRAARCAPSSTTCWCMAQVSSSRRTRTPRRPTA